MAIGQASPKVGKVIDIPDRTVTIGTATDGGTGTTASITFTPGSETTGGPVFYYTGTSTPGSFTATAASSPVIVSGLTAGTAYTFKVKASNASGSGPESGASNSVTPVTPVVRGFDFIAQASGSMSSVSFTSLPSGYASFRLLFNAYIGGESIGYIQFNGDSTDGRYSEYSMGWAFNNPPQNYGSSNSSQQQRRYAASANSNSTAQVQIDITNPDQSLRHQVFMYSGYGGTAGSGGANTWSNGNYNLATPITSITLGGGNGPTPSNTWTNSIITLYGRKRGVAL